MLADLIVGAVGQGHLSLSRNTRTILPKIKTLGDWSAHTLRHTAVKADMDKIHLDVRCVVGELIALAGLK